MVRKSEVVAIFKIYFVTLGFMSLLYWNSLLNVIDYFDASIEPLFFTVLTFAFCSGQVIAFIVGPKLFSRLNMKQTLTITAVCCSFVFLAFIYFAEGTSYLVAKKWLTGISSFSLGFFMASFQGTSFGLAGSISNSEIILVNFGTGLAGVLPNVLATALAQLIPMDPKKPPLETLRNRVFLYALLMLVFLGGYFLIQFLFSRRFPDFWVSSNNAHDDLIDNPSTPQEPVQDSEIISRSITAFTGLSFMYLVSISFLAYIVIASYFKFDKSSNFFIISTYMLFFNFFDTIGKFFPAHMLIKREIVIQTVAFLRIFIWIFAFYILRANELSESLKNPWIRVAMCAVMGITNGYLTNCFMANCTDRFARSAEKGRAGYFSVFFLIIGVLAGSILGVVLGKL